MFQVFLTEREAGSADDGKSVHALHRALLKSGVFIAPSQLECWFTSAEHDNNDLKIILLAITNAAGEISK